MKVVCHYFNGGDKATVAGDSGSRKRDRCCKQTAGVGIYREIEEMVFRLHTRADGKADGAFRYPVGKAACCTTAKLALYGERCLVETSRQQPESAWSVLTMNFLTKINVGEDPLGSIREERIVKICIANRYHPHKIVRPGRQDCSTKMSRITNQNQMTKCRRNSRNSSRGDLLVAIITPIFISGYNDHIPRTAHAMSKGALGSAGNITFQYPYPERKSAGLFHCCWVEDDQGRSHSNGVPVKMRSKPYPKFAGNKRVETLYDHIGDSGALVAIYGNGAVWCRHGSHAIWAIDQCRCPLLFGRQVYG